MGLSNRKEKIIQAVVDSYIESCQPISSAEIKDRYLPGLSSATIRNELAALEEMGYLTQPHVSSGRIPTAQAYKMYVDKLMPKRRLTKAELGIIKKYFNSELKGVESVVKNTAKVISEITNLTSVAYVQNLGDDVIQNIKIVKITDTVVLFVIVTDKTIIKDTTASVPAAIGEKYFTDAGDFVTQLFAVHRISEVLDPERLSRQIRKEYEKVFKAVVRILKNYCKEGMSDIVLEGSAKILEQPEYATLSKAKAMMRLLDAKEQLYPVLAMDGGMNLSIKIAGDGEVAEDMPECAIVTASYELDGTVGSAGVIGPMRMDYSKVISVLDYIGKTLSSLDKNREEEKESE